MANDIDEMSKRLRSIRDGVTGFKGWVQKMFMRGIHASHFNKNLFCVLYFFALAVRDKLRFILLCYEFSREKIVNTLS